MCGYCRNVVPLERDLSAGFGNKIAYGVHYRSFSRAVRTDESNDFSLIYSERHAFYRLYQSVVDFEVGNFK